MHRAGAHLKATRERTKGEKKRTNKLRAGCFHIEVRGIKTGQFGTTFQESATCWYNGTRKSCAVLGTRTQGSVSRQLNSRQPAREPKTLQSASANLSQPFQYFQHKGAPPYPISCLLTSSTPIVSPRSTISIFPIRSFALVVKLPPSPHPSFCQKTPPFPLSQKEHPQQASHTTRSHNFKYPRSTRI